MSAANTIIFMEKILNALISGQFIIVFDEHREEEADFFCLAEHITTEKINFLLEKAKGMICVACEKSILKRINSPLLTKNNTSPHQTNFCMPLDAKKGTTTGVSASDRAKTIKQIANPKSTKKDFTSPGHTATLQAETNYKKRFGHTEAAIFLAKKAKAIQAVVICEILDKKGNKANIQQIKKLATTHNLTITTLEQIKTWTVKHNSHKNL